MNIVVQKSFLDEHRCFSLSLCTGRSLVVRQKRFHVGLLNRPAILLTLIVGLSLDRLLARLFDRID